MNNKLKPALLGRTDRRQCSALRFRLLTIAAVFGPSAAARLAAFLISRVRLRRLRWATARLLVDPPALWAASFISFWVCQSPSSLEWVPMEVQFARQGIHLPFSGVILMILFGIIGAGDSGGAHRTLRGDY